jgi:hypothetical protein
LLLSEFQFKYLLIAFNLNNIFSSVLISLDAHNFAKSSAKRVDSVVVLLKEVLSNIRFIE